MKPSTRHHPDPEQIVRDLLDWVENEDNDMRETGRAPNVNDWHKLHNRVMRLDAVMSQFTEIRTRRVWQAIGLLLLGVYAMTRWSRWTVWVVFVPAVALVTWLFFAHAVMLLPATL